MSPPQSPEPLGPMGPRIVGGVFGFVFFGIGLTVLIFLWSAPFGEFGSPPLVFRVFGSFIAIAFVTLGGATALGAITGKMGLGTQRMKHLQRLADQLADRDDSPGDSSDATGKPNSAVYGCPQCGAPLAEGSDVSPHGDTKCVYCNCWFNVHGR